MSDDTHYRCETMLSELFWKWVKILLISMTTVPAPLTDAATIQEF